MTRRKGRKSKSLRDGKILISLSACLIMAIAGVLAVLVVMVQSQANKPLYSKSYEDVEDEYDPGTVEYNGDIRDEYTEDNHQGADSYELTLDNLLNVSIPHDDWRLILVNGSNPVPSNYEPRLISLDNGQKVDERILEPLNAMLGAARGQGLTLQVDSGFRSVSEQQVIFDGTVNHWMSMGLSYQEAVVETKRWVTTPGTSEHHLGLAVDISEASSWSWLREHSADFGFILRFPKGSEEITGFAYEPWHFRYVGVDVAREITSRGITLEEFLQDLLTN